MRICPIHWESLACMATGASPRESRERGDPKIDLKCSGEATMDTRRVIKKEDNKEK